MIIDILRDAILTNIGQLRPAPKNWSKRCCMLCHTQGHGKDTKNRFGIQFNPDSIALNCFNCGFSASYTEGKDLSKSFKLFLTQLNIDDKFIKHIEFEIFKRLNQLVSVRDGDTGGVLDPELRLSQLLHRWVPIALPKDSLPILTWLEYGLEDPNFLKVVNYIISRGLFDLSKFYWSPIKEYGINKRFIIPYYYRNKIVGYTARLGYDTNSKNTPKYHQQCPTDFVYNLDNQQDWTRKYVIVNEGILDAFVTDGVSVLGEIGQAKVDLINRLHKQVILCPDRDKKGHDLVDVAIDNGWAVAFPKWTPDIKDSAAAAQKYGRLLTIHSIIDSAISKKEKIKIKWSIEQNARERKRTY